MDWVYLIFLGIAYAVYRIVKYMLWDDVDTRHFLKSALTRKPTNYSQPLKPPPTSAEEPKQGEGDPVLAAYLRGYNEGYQRGKSDGFSDGYASGTMFRN